MTESAKTWTRRGSRCTPSRLPCNGSSCFHSWSPPWHAPAILSWSGERRNGEMAACILPLTGCEESSCDWNRQRAVCSCHYQAWRGERCPTEGVLWTDLTISWGRNKEVVLSLCLTNEALHLEDVWGSGCIDMLFRALGEVVWRNKNFRNKSLDEFQYWMRGTHLHRRIALHGVVGESFLRPWLLWIKQLVRVTLHHVTGQGYFAQGSWSGFSCGHGYFESNSLLGLLCTT
jgi:hypothetical protein